ncbi:hypothetical protein F4821DRAFT_265880 [Hypoxylon rubiginosum]|uniref:Uncharacterized protein n=1 Tax=Hypoxylon rubiginosum TaxID=110542 RepID=A0ACC0CJ78_9PEZI|nr:hypothetical protein F4821DRAFT_265880 [Hypoxylon rubiginosum]
MENHECSLLLKEAIVPLSKVRGSPPSKTSPASNKFSTKTQAVWVRSKTQAIIEAIQNVKNEYVILFAQFDQQIEELKKAMTKHDANNAGTNDPTKPYENVFVANPGPFLGMHFRDLLEYANIEEEGPEGLMCNVCHAEPLSVLSAPGRRATGRADCIHLTDSIPTPKGELDSSEGGQCFTLEQRPPSLANRRPTPIGLSNCMAGRRLAEDVPKILEEIIKDVANMGESSQTLFSMLGLLHVGIHPRLSRNQLWQHYVLPLVLSTREPVCLELPRDPGSEARSAQHCSERIMDPQPAGHAHLQTTPAMDGVEGLVLSDGKFQGTVILPDGKQYIAKMSQKSLRRQSRMLPTWSSQTFLSMLAYIRDYHGINFSKPASWLLMLACICDRLSPERHEKGSSASVLSLRQPVRIRFQTFLITLGDNIMFGF